MQAMEMKYLRKVKGITRMHRVRNDLIWEDIGIEPLQDFIEKRQLSWWGHLNRMNHERPARKVWEAKVTGKRRRGRPVTTWDKQMGKIIGERGQTWERARKMTANKKEWSKFVYEGRIGYNQHYYDFLQPPKMSIILEASIHHRYGLSSTIKTIIDYW
ncbi:uncharacterized protein LOC123306527 [Coccinella septempunctata]|uniref:uncharacterized protein LOC123306527 n=1 Tax=Coccinella septempunctata TaxID=41139 RepID=UPI001D06E5B9|nr:uncharacterized protein LOC123306527 [Coccinella septempunctata]